MWLYWTIIINALTTIHCNRPIFSDDAWIQMLFLPYDTPPGSAIYRVQANDNEAVPHYPLTFTVGGRGSDVVDIISVSATEADLVLKQRLKKGSIYPIALQVSDTANEKNVIEIRINATDVSVMVNSALLSYPEKPISVPEDTRPGSVIGTIIAKKRSGSDRYPDLILSRGPYNKLLDNRNILILPITIVVEDVQDTNPIFTQLPLLTRMRSDMPAGTSILQIKAIDGDRSSARSIVYSIQGENSQHFHMNPKTGQISTSNPGHQILKGCQDSAFIILVKAEEENDRRAQSIQEIVIFIEAATKPQPKFTPDVLRISIDENVAMLTELTRQQTLRLVDEASGNCAVLRVSIQDEGSTKASEIFDINPSQVIHSSDIKIFVKNPIKLDYEQIKEVTFRIIARPQDPSFESFTSTAVITVTINDLNDNAPIFLREVYETKIPENAAEGTLVTQVSATDLESGNKGEIRYTRILGDNQISEVFKLDADTGVISVTRRGALDRESVDRYEFEVEACDQHGRGLCNKTKVIVQVTDDNDNKPTFDSNHYYACLTPGMKRGEIFFNLKAIDKDEPDTANSFIMYEITGGNTNGYFSVNQQGNLSVTRDASSIPKNQETQLYIRARDDGSTPQSSETTVHISAVSYSHGNGVQFSATIGSAAKSGRICLQQLHNLSANDFLHTSAEICSKLSDPARCTQRIVEYVVSKGKNEITNKKAEYERILTELNSGSITRIDQVKTSDDSSKSRIVTSIVQHANRSVVDLTVWDREFGMPNGPSGGPSSEPSVETIVVAATESEAWKWILIALLILLAIVFIILLCCCLCKPNSKSKTAQVYNKQRNHSTVDDQRHPTRPRHHHRHRQHHVTDRITSAPMVNGKTNIPYSRHVAEEVIVDPPSARKQQATAISNGEAVISKSANLPRIVQELQATESSGQSEVVAVVSEDTTVDVDDNGPQAQLKNQFLEKKSLFTIAYDGMHSKHDLLKDKDYPPSTNTPVS
uniref:Cadherin domain-containing protein n=1 Tax=Strigamia maritima TaxID=126957 RepID=T1IYZ1_STRMM